MQKREDFAQPISPLLREAAQILYVPGKTTQDVIGFLRSRGKSRDGAESLAARARKLVRRGTIEMLPNGDQPTSCP